MRSFGSLLFGHMYRRGADYRFPTHPRFVCGVVFDDTGHDIQR